MNITQHKLKKKPVFKSSVAQYEIDTCAPQNQAIQSGKVRWHGLTKGHYPGTLMPGNVLPGLNAIGFWDANGTPDWGEEAHRNEGIEFVFLETGATAMTVDSKLYQIRPGQFTITRPWQLHKIGAPNIGPSLLYWVILDVGVRRPHQKWHWPKWIMITTKDLAQFTQKLRHNENPVWNATPAITDSFRRIGRCIDSWGQSGAVSRLVIHLNALFLNIFDAIAFQQSEDIPTLTSPRRTVESFLSELKNNIAISSEPWSKQRMAQHCHLGTTSFTKYCRELVNSGPVEYLRLCRLDLAAKMLLADPGKPITDIAFACGFNTSQYFATCFGQHFKCTPKNYRLRNGLTIPNSR